MPEKLESDQLTPLPVERIQQSDDLPIEVLVHEWRQNARQLVRVFTALAGLSFALCIVLYFQTNAWQMLLVAAGLGLTLLCLPVAYWFIRREKLDAAEYWLMLGTMLVFCVFELGWSGATVYSSISGALLIFLAGLVILRYYWSAALVTVILFGICVWVINFFEPLPRYDAMQLGILHVYVAVVTVFLVLFTFWRLVRIYRRLATIRTRLLIAFILLVVLPATATAVISNYLSARTIERRTMAQLESVAAVKHAEINTWIDNLHTDLALALTGQETTGHAIELLAGDGLEMSQISYDIIQSHFQRVIERTGRFDMLFLISLDGQVVFSTDSAIEGSVYKAQTYFKEGLKGVYFQPPARIMSVVLSRPVTDEQGRVRGVMAGFASLDELNRIMGERTGLGNTGETYLVSAGHQFERIGTGYQAKYILLTESRFDDRDADGNTVYIPGNMVINTRGARTALQNEENGSGFYQNYRQQPRSVIGVYRWLPELRATLLAEQERNEVLGSVLDTIIVNGLVTLVLVAVATLAGIFVTRGIATPLVELSEAATRIAGGDLERTVIVEREDEIGTLALAFNSMVSQLRGLVEDLEQRVIERTRDLERRSAYLETSSEVGRAATTILDTEQLIRQVIELIRKRFGLYYVGLFRMDQAGEWAVLQAGTGEAGRTMLARSHRIRVGEGMVGWSIANAEPRVSLEAGEDAVRLATAELPDTRSEAALPMRSRGQVLGALTVQSDQAQAFDEDLLMALQTVADQVGVALDNAHLFAKSEETVEAMRRVYGQLSRQSWIELLRDRPGLGFRRDRHGMTSLTDQDRPQTLKLEFGDSLPLASDDTILRPVMARDQVVGMVEVRKPQGASGWTAEEITLLEALVEQLGVALEGARLYEETQRLAQRERLAREITDKVRAAPDIESIAQVAVEELTKALEGMRGFVQLSAPTLDDNGGGASG